MASCSVRFRICPLQLVFIAVMIAVLIASCQNDDDAQADSADSSSPTSTAEADAEPTTNDDVSQEPPDATSTGASDEPTLGPDGHFTEIQVSDGGTKHLIPLDQVFAGGPAKDGIPSIDSPVFVGPEEWDQLEYSDDKLVIGVEVDGERRAYPFQVLVWHEITNDTVGGKPLLISYCPLCGSAIVFERHIDGDPVEFGVSGQLYNSDLLMYDRFSDTLWSQITGTAVVGELTGQRLTIYPSEVMTWADWKATYPESVVLSRDTGHDRNYDVDPYGNYYVDGSIMFPVSGQDDRLPLKARVTGVELDAETFAAYPDNDVRDHGPINDLVGDVPLLIVADPTAGDNIIVFDRQIDDGQTLTFEWDGDELIDDETGSRWTSDGEAVEGEMTETRLEAIPTIKGFWFAWFAFHPETALWLPE